MCWAFENAKTDLQEKFNLIAEIIKGVRESLKPWLNYQLWQAEQKAKEQATTISSTYVEELRKRGVTEEELQGAIETENRLRQAANENDLGDTGSLSDEEEDSITVLKPK